MTLFGSLFRAHGVPSLFAMFGDDTVEILYRVSRDAAEFVRVFGIKRHDRKEFVQDPEGGILKLTMSQLVLATDPFHPWGAIQDPQLKGEFEIQQPGLEAMIWAVDSQPGKGIQKLSESLVEVDIIKVGAAAKASANLYR